MGHKRGNPNRVIKSFALNGVGPATLHRAVTSGMCGDVLPASTSDGTGLQKPSHARGPSRGLPFCARPNYTK